MHPCERGRDDLVSSQLPHRAGKVELIVVPLVGFALGQEIPEVDSVSVASVFNSEDLEVDCDHAIILPCPSRPAQGGVETFYKAVSGDLSPAGATVNASIPHRGSRRSAERTPR